MDVKLCSYCKETKAIDNFIKVKRGGSKGRHSYCKACNKEKNKLFRLANPDKYSLYCKKYRERNPTKAAEYTEKNKEKINSYTKEWTKNNKEKSRAKCVAYRTRRIKAALNYEKYKDEIVEIYKNCPEGYEVDHIIPLKGKNVRGFHVPWNLQYLPKIENRKKGNRYVG